MLILIFSLSSIDYQIIVISIFLCKSQKDFSVYNFFVIKNMSDKSQYDKYSVGGNLGHAAGHLGNAALKVGSFGYYEGI